MFFGLFGKKKKKESEKVAEETKVEETKVQTASVEKKEDEKPKRILNPEDTKQGGNADQAQAMNKSMMYFMPFFTGWIAFSYSAALGFYWSLSNVLSILQQMYLNHKYGEKFKEEVKAIEDEKEKARKERRKLKQKRK